MPEENFAIALSEKESEEAVKEISLKIKPVFPLGIKCLLVLFTPHYSPALISKTLNFTLKPHLLFGVQAPLLIFDGRIIEKGLIACCINKKDAALKELLVADTHLHSMENSLRHFHKSFHKNKRFIFSFLSHHTDPSAYLHSIELTLGNVFTVFGMGHTKKFSAKNYRLLNHSLTEETVTLGGEGIDIEFLRSSGFVPLGKPFALSKVIRKSRVIMEINGQPALSIYRHYLNEKFDLFKSNRLFTLYPLGIRTKDTHRLIQVLDYLEDGSLLCSGEFQQNDLAQIMLFHPPSFFKTLPEKISSLGKDHGGIALIVNSLLRKKILKEYAEEELQTIKHSLGSAFKMVGLYGDYCLFPDVETKKPIIEAGTLTLTLWQ